MAARQLSDNRADGQKLGQSATDLIGFYTATPVDQPAAVAAVTTTAITSVTTTASTSTTNAYGYVTAAQADAIVTAINDIITRQALMITQGNAHRTNLNELGLQAT